MYTEDELTNIYINLAMFFYLTALSSIYTAVAGFITRSSGLISALAFWIVGMIFGYVSGDNPGPNPEATFKYLISAVPFCLLLISFIISLFLKNVRNGKHKSNGMMSYSGVVHHG